MSAANRLRLPDPDTRRSILDQASQLLAEAGPDALTMRRLSQRIGSSTIVLYTHFRDKSAILNELYVEGFGRLRDDLLRVVPDRDPTRHVMDLGRAYWRSALANPTYYQLMFSRCVPGFEPAPESREAGKQPFVILAAAVQRCIDAGLATDTTAAQLAHTLWGTLHGLISLELFGYMASSSDAEARLEQALRIMQAGIGQPRTAEVAP